MILRSSVLKVCDQSGVKTAKCVGFLKSIKTHCVGINEVIRICIKKFDRNRFFTQHTVAKKGKSAVMARVVAKEISKYEQKKKRVQLETETLLYLAVIISTSKKWHRHDGTCIRTHLNRAVFLDNSYKLRSFRLLGPVNKELRMYKRVTPFYNNIYSNARRRI